MKSTIKENEEESKLFDITNKENHHLEESKPAITELKEYNKGVSAQYNNYTFHSNPTPNVTNITRLCAI